MGIRAKVLSGDYMGDCCTICRFRHECHAAHMISGTCWAFMPYERDDDGE